MNASFKKHFLLSLTVGLAVNAVLAFTLYFLYIMQIGPLLEKFLDKKTELDSVNQRIVFYKEESAPSLENAAPTLDALEALFYAHYSRGEAVKQLKDLKRFYEFLEATARSNNLQLSIGRRPNLPDIGSESASTAPIFAFGIDGTYENALRFIRQTEEGPFFIVYKSLSLQGSGKGAVRGSATILLKVL